MANNTNELTAKLKAAAQKATALNLDTAQVKRGNDGYLECPCCEGAGYVEEENDFCNIDGVALGVQFYGIGQHHGLAEEYLRAASPENVLALTEALEAARHESAVNWEAATSLVEENEELKRRIAELEARTLTVKLPSLNQKMFNDDVMFGYRKAQREAVEFCAAAGIKLQIEGE